MSGQKSEIIQQLEREILPLQGFKGIVEHSQDYINPGPLGQAFPGGKFPLGAVHEFLSPDAENQGATTGFIAAIVSMLMNCSGVAIWISSSRTIFPHGLRQFGVAPERVIFLDLKNDQQVAWALEESLKTPGMAAVVGEMKELDFITSRRFQLAVESSLVTAFIIRKKKNIQNNASLARWKISALPSYHDEAIPGLGFPAWKVELVKIRNGKPGRWNLFYKNGNLFDSSARLMAYRNIHQKTA